jgi:NAD(P)-dependent dehydrogenase (short-subunit alcohol dehydrogenase family)
MEYRDRHVIVTGGTGALGSAVVNALVEAGAFCHVPYIDAIEAERFTLRAPGWLPIPRAKPLSPR